MLTTTKLRVTCDHRPDGGETDWPNGPTIRHEPLPPDNVAPDVLTEATITAVVGACADCRTQHITDITSGIGLLGVTEHDHAYDPDTGECDHCGRTFDRYEGMS